MRAADVDVMFAMRRETDAVVALPAALEFMVAISGAAACVTRTRDPSGLNHFFQMIRPLKGVPSGKWFSSKARPFDPFVHSKRRPPEVLGDGGESVNPRSSAQRFVKPSMVSNGSSGIPMEQLVVPMMSCPK